MSELEEIEKYMNGNIEEIRGYLGEEAGHLLDFNTPKISREMLHHLLQIPSIFVEI